MRRLTVSTQLSASWNCAWGLGRAWDQMCPFRREGDRGKQGLPLQSSPGLGRASGQALVSEEEPSPRTAPGPAVLSRAHGLTAGPFLTVSCGLALQKTGHVRKVSPSSEARRASLHVLVVTYSVAHNGEATAPLSSVCACTHVFWRRF